MQNFPGRGISPTPPSRHTCICVPEHAFVRYYHPATILYETLIWELVGSVCLLIVCMATNYIKKIFFVIPTQLNNATSENTVQNIMLQDYVLDILHRAGISTTLTVRATCVFDRDVCNFLVFSCRLTFMVIKYLLAFSAVY